MKSPLIQAEEWMQMGKEVAIATVISTWNSSPASVGSQLVIDDLDDYVGCVSGGCIEQALIVKAKKVIETGDPIRLDFEVSNETALANGIDCGGRIEIYLERLG